MDTQTLTVLEDFLESFSGVVITVSHDRYFLDKVASELLVFQGFGQVDSYFGTYSEYLEVKAEEIVPKEVEKTTAPKQEKEKKKRLSYMEKREWETIEDDIAKVEEQLNQIEEDLSSIGSDFTKGQQLLEQQSELNAKLEHLMERWEYLSEIAEG